MSFCDDTNSKQRPSSGCGSLYTHNLLHFLRPKRMMNL